MFALCIVLLCAIELATSHLINDITDTQWQATMQVELALVLAAVAFSKNTMRERSVLDIIFIWVVWTLATDWLPYFPPVIATWETAVFACLLAWVWWRPYHHVSAPFGHGTVFIAFYGGPNGPFLSRIFSHFGFPFSSIAMVADNIAVRPSKKTGTMVFVHVRTLQLKGYIFIDTGVSVTEDIKNALIEVQGTETGFGIFRFKCLQNLMPVLDQLGPNWKPDKMPYVPAWYYRKCLKNADEMAQHEQRQATN